MKKKSFASLCCTKFGVSDRPLTNKKHASINENVVFIKRKIIFTFIKIKYFETVALNSIFKFRTISMLNKKQNKKKTLPKKEFCVLKLLPFSKMMLSLKRKSYKHS